MQRAINVNGVTANTTSAYNNGVSLIVTQVSKIQVTTKWSKQQLPQCAYYAISYSGGKISQASDRGRIREKREIYAPQKIWRYCSQSHSNV